MTKVTARKARNTFKGNAVTRSLLSLVKEQFGADAEVSAIQSKADEAIAKVRGTMLEKQKAVADAMFEEHGKAINADTFDAAYGTDIKAAFMVQYAKGYDEKTAKMRTGTAYLNLRNALLGFMHDVAIPEGMQSAHAYSQHARKELQDQGIVARSAKGRKKGSAKAGKVKSARATIDAGELQPKGESVSFGIEIIDMLRLAKDQGLLADVHEFLAELTAE